MARDMCSKLALRQIVNAWKVLGISTIVSLRPTNLLGALEKNIMEMQHGRLDIAP